ncbi:GSU3473 family protein [Pelobacter seleniigenes]|uniref:GSU3473 family protein n=1 Tax=Pelobacter seleniigenes TaxID=407188 RepID=UPI0012B8CB3B|nr:hypothetical protein [Pelobacter seleniigenes]
MKNVATEAFGKEGILMKIQVILNGGQERFVDKDELQFLFLTRQVFSFKRSAGWVVVGRDQMRAGNKKMTGEDRRYHGKFSREHWY